MQNPNNVKDSLVRLLTGKSIDLESDAEWVADLLIENGVTILPEGAIVLTRAEIDALGKYEECRMQNAECIIASDVAEEIFAELLNEIDKAIDFTADSRRIRFELCQQKDIDPYKDRFFNVFDGKYNCVLGFGKYITELKKKYTEGGE